MKTFWAWKHDIYNTDKDKSDYTKILARDLNSAMNKAHKHYRHHMFNSTFNVSVMSGETDEHGYAKECEYSTGQWTRKAWSAYNYFHSLTPGMQEFVYNHYRNNNSDWKDKSKEELQAIVGELSNVPVPPDSCFDTPGNTKPSANAWGESSNV